MSDAYPEYIEEFSIEIADFNPIGPTVYIPLPEILPKRNNGIINIQNEDDCSLNYKIVSHNLYRGPDALERFVLKIEEELLAIQEDLSALAEMIMAPEDLKAYNEATECWICIKPFLKPAPEVVQKLEKAKYNLLEIKEWESCMEKEHPEKKEAQKTYQKALSTLNQKVKDHDHINKNYQGPAHDTYNKKLQIGFFETKVPLICHNFWGYDSHLLMKVVSKFTADKINCILENIGKYKAIDVGQLRFLDSFQHIGMGLDKLVECLEESLKNFP
ncbi:hypothetical protein RhiirC2_715129 [Rhizophagus irregularis]|uniref:DNA-directed DNA polymerase n=1 Tax=Rhizophagus irregularis TaxID=588596 RepID=A0A2N1MWL6_9GLOM|nr:hypothetical protein RhiirC2_715129 [Rhizophagus irregularis]